MSSLAPSKEIGDKLFALFLNLAKSDSLDRSISEIIKKRNEERANWESVYLKIAAVEFGVFLALGNTPEKNEILDIFFEHIEAMATKEGMPNKFFMQDLKSRQLAYSNAIKRYLPEKNNNQPLVYAIGETFTEVSGISKDDRVIMQAGSIFGAVSSAVRDLIKSFELK